MIALLVIAAALFALQFLFNKSYKNAQGKDLSSIWLFSLLTNLFGFFLMLGLNGFTLQFSWFSLLIAAIASANGILYTYFSFKALDIVNLSVYSIFAMLGGMMLPFLQGIIFYGEKITAPKVICCVLIIVSLALTAEKGKGGKKAFLCYAAVFLLNGMSGVLSKIHQSAPALATSSENYMALKSAITVVVCLAWILIKYKKLPEIRIKPFLFASFFSIFSGVGNLLCLIALTSLDASIQYPLITGGTMVFSTLICFFTKDKPKLKTIIATVIAIAASVIIAL